MNKYQRERRFAYLSQIPVADVCLLAGVILALLAGTIQKHQTGKLDFGLRSCAIKSGEKHKGYAYRITLDDQPGGEFDPSAAVCLFENGKRLIPVNTVFEVLNEGGGRYFAGAEGIFVSSTDHSDVANNGCSYQVMQPIPIPAGIQSTVWMVSLVLCLVGVIALLAQRVPALLANLHISPTTIWHGHRKAFQAAMAISVFLVAWIFTGNLIRTLDVDPDVDAVTAKVELACASDSGPHDTVFVGSSRIFRHAAPTRFDADMTQLGWDVSSFNIGIPGLQVIEMPSVLRKLFKQDTNHNIKFVLLQLEPFGVEISEKNLLSNRNIRAHDFRTFSLLAQHIFSLRQLPASERLALIQQQLAPFWYRQNNLGVASRVFHGWIEGQTSRVPNLKKFMSAKLDNGHLAIDAETSAQLKKRAEVFRLTSKPAKGKFLPAIACADVTSPAALKLIAEIDKLVRDHGAIPVFVASPPRDSPQLTAAYKSGLIQHLIRLNDIDRFPELYFYEMYFDGGHLNGKGATLFTAHLAREFAETIQAGNRMANRPGNKGVLR